MITSAVQDASTFPIALIKQVPTLLPHQNQREITSNLFRASLVNEQLRKGSARMRISCWQCGIALLMAIGLLAGCHDGQNIPGYTVATGGSAQRGHQVISQFKCGKCHTIPGIDNANGVVGPPLNFIARRTIIAGNFPNEPNFLVQWIRTPEQMKPKTAMPDLGLTEQQARDAAAYLYTLQ